MFDFISTDVVADDYGCTHPDKAVIWIDGHAFTAEDPGDWEQSLRLAAPGVTLVRVPKGGAPGPLWMEASKRFARMVLCSCGRPLDPDGEGFDCRLCPACFEAEGWENTHSDYGHEQPGRADPECPICQASKAMA